MYQVRFLIVGCMELFWVGGNWRPSSFRIYWNFCTVVLTSGLVLWYCCHCLFNHPVIIFPGVFKLAICFLGYLYFVGCYQTTNTQFLISTEYMKISIIWSGFESLLYYKLMANDY